MRFIKLSQFNKIFTSVIHKCNLFSDFKTIAPLENYTCESFIELTPGFTVSYSYHLLVNGRCLHFEALGVDGF